MSFTSNLKPLALSILIGLAVLLRCGQAEAGQTETLTVAGGCFWCVEADFETVPGVKDAITGFTGGELANPTFKQVKRGGTGHFEAVQITFDPGVITRASLLSMFFRSIDPTDAGGQFCDRGRTFSTAIFVANSGEKAIAAQAIELAQSALGQRIVTPILTLTRFYPAEAFHQNYSSGNKIVLTRFGPKRQAQAYRKYRIACGRDARVRQLWGNRAAFAKGQGNLP